MTTRDGRLVEGLLLEIDGNGRPTRLELTNAAGLLTLHPEPSGSSLHGNLVTPLRVRHLAFAWSGEHELAIDRLPVAAAVTARRLAGTTPVGEGRAVPVVSVAEDLEVREGRRRYHRVTETEWRIEGADNTAKLSIDERGLPIWQDASGEAAEWPLELEPQP